MAEGWVKLYRKLVDWRWYKDTNTKVVFLHLLITANYEDKDWQTITIRRGQRVCSYATLGEELGLSYQQARTAIAHLKLTGEITVRATGRYSIITIPNYGKYQALYGECEEGETIEPTESSTGRNAGYQQGANRVLTTTKEVKKIRSKEDKNNTTPISPSLPKVQYAENVHMTEKEHDALVALVGDEGTAFCIDKLDTYKAANGKKYKSDYAAIRNWAIDRWEQEKKRRGANGRGGADRSPVGYYEPHDASHYDQFTVQ